MKLWITEHVNEDGAAIGPYIKADTVAQANRIAIQYGLLVLGEIQELEYNNEEEKRIVHQDQDNILMSIEYRGERFSGYNKPKRTPKHPTKSHVVLAKVGDIIKMIRFGEQGASTAGKPKAGESAKMKAKRKSFKARHGKNIAKGKLSAAYWADKVKW